MLTIEELKNAAIDFDQATNAKEDTLIALVDKIFDTTDENREITTNELVQFFNVGISSKLHTPITSENYKQVCRLIHP